MNSVKILSLDFDAKFFKNIKIYVKLKKCNLYFFSNDRKTVYSCFLMNLNSNAQFISLSELFKGVNAFIKSILWY